MTSQTYIFKNTENGIVNVYINAQCKEQAETILRFIVLNPENFKFEMVMK